MKTLNAIGQLISSPLFAVVVCAAGGVAIWRYSAELAAAASGAKLGGGQVTVEQTLVNRTAAPSGGDVSPEPKPNKARNSRNAPPPIAAKRPDDVIQRRSLAARKAEVEADKPLDRPSFAAAETIERADQQSDAMAETSAETAAADPKDSRPAAEGKKLTSMGPESVLENRGLKKEGTFYVVAAEHEFHKGYSQMVPIYNVMEAKYNRFVAICDAQATYDWLDNERIFAETRIRDINIVIGGLGRLPVDQVKRDELLFEQRNVTRYLSDVTGWLAIAKKELVPYAIKQGVHDEFMSLRADLQKAADQLEPTRLKAVTEYAGLYSDTAVTDAVNTLAQRTNSPLRLGPSKAMRNEILRLKQTLQMLSFNPNAYRGKSSRSSKMKKK
jgi:hypothetical protein